MSNSFMNRGRFFVLLVVLITIGAGWSLYSTMIAPRWMRDFGLELAAKARIVSTQPVSTVFSTMKNRPEPDSPYICLNRITPFDWDRVYFVGSGGAFTSSLRELDWGRTDLAEIENRMQSDDRYQLIAFTKGGAVVEHGFYFTMWADLSELDRDIGYARQDAVFVAESDGAVYRVFEASHTAQWPLTVSAVNGVCND